MQKSVTIATLVVAACASAACGDSASHRVTAPSAAPASLAVSPNADARTLHGNGEVTQREGVVYRNTIQARLDASGQASGTLMVHILDLSGFDMPDVKATLIVRISCLEFDGESVWFGGEVTSSSNKDLLDPSLATTIGQVKVTNGQSHLFSGPAAFYTPPGTTCKDRPALPITPVTTGGFRID